MKRRICAAVLAVIMIFGMIVTGYAQTYKLSYDSSYNADSDTVSVTLYVESPGAVQSADFNLAFDPEVLEYVDCDDSKATANAMVAAGKSVLEEGLAVCSLMFVDACTDADLDENGNLMLVTFTFKPLTEDYDIDNFCFWAGSYSVNDVDVVDMIAPVGSTQLKTSHTAAVTVKATASTSATTTAANGENNADGNVMTPSSSSSSSSGGTKWYVYVIASVLAIGAVAGIAFIAIKNNHDSENVKESSEDKKKKIDSSEE